MTVRVGTGKYAIGIVLGVAGAGCAERAFAAGPVCSPLNVSIEMNEYPKQTASGERIGSMGKYIMPTRTTREPVTQRCEIPDDCKLAGGNTEDHARSEIGGMSF